MENDLGDALRSTVGVQTRSFDGLGGGIGWSTIVADSHTSMNEQVVRSTSVVDKLRAEGVCG